MKKSIFTYWFIVTVMTCVNIGIFYYMSSRLEAYVSDDLVRSAQMSAQHNL